MPEGRPIVSDVDSESYRICSYIDSFLTKISNKHPAYLKNTYDFLDKIRNQNILPTDILVTADVSALYTNMKLDRTMQCVTEAFRQYPDRTRPDQQILELLDIILNNNDFTFNNQWFRQECGVSMGRAVGPSLANLYMVEFDRIAREGYHISPKFYFRFLDDIFFIWSGSLEELDKYITFLNSQIPGIKLTHEPHDTHVNFLDTTVYKHSTTNPDSCTLQTRTYFKDTDTHQLLHTLSHHPKHTTKGILKSQFIRFKRLSSSREDYYNTCKILTKALMGRGYSRSLMLKLQRDIFFRYDGAKNKSDDNKRLLPVITHFDGLGQKLSKEYKNVLREHGVHNKFRVISAFRNHKNIRQSLIHNKIEDETLRVPVSPVAVRQVSTTVARPSHRKKYP
jgi:hypothetical protein